jgi:hypothetical protein
MFLITFPCLREASPFMRNGRYPKHFLVFGNIADQLCTQGSPVLADNRQAERPSAFQDYVLAGRSKYHQSSFVHQPNVLRKERLQEGEA